MIDDCLPLGEESCDRKSHCDAVIVKALELSAFERVPTFDHHAILCLGNGYAHGAKISGDSSNAVGLLNSKLLGVTDDGYALG